MAEGPAAAAAARAVVGPPWRTKIYELQSDGQWADSGTGEASVTAVRNEFHEIRRNCM